MKTDWLQLISPCVRPVLRRSSYKSYTESATHGPTWTEPLRVIYDHELVLFSEGCCRIEIENREYDCPANSFIIIPPGRWHATWNVGRGPTRRHWSHFDWAYAGPHENTPILTYHPAKPRPAFYRPAPAFVPHTILHGKIPAPARAYDLMDRLCQTQLFDGKHEKLASRAVLLDLLIQLLDEPEVVSEPHQRSSWLARQVRERLKDAVDQGGDVPSIKQIFGEFHYTYAHLCRLFRAEFGIPPLKYMQALRISRAKLLMRDTQLNISEIAQRMNFDDLAYFSKLFRQMTGQTPTAYRSRLKGG